MKIPSTAALIRTAVVSLSLAGGACSGSDPGPESALADAGTRPPVQVDAAATEASAPRDAALIVDTARGPDDAIASPFEAGGGEFDAALADGAIVDAAPADAAPADASLDASLDARAPMVDGALLSCPAGFFVTPLGECRACQSGSFSLGGAVTSCTPWASCAPGEFIRTAGTARSDRVCAPCAPGTFSGLANATKCDDWGTCKPGQYVLAEGTATTNRSCAGCGPATFSTTSNAATCAPWRTCNPGQFASRPGSSLEDRVCASCAAGTYTDYPNASGCSRWTTCFAGYFAQSAATASADRVCVPCAQGTYTSSDNATACVACAPNTFSGPAASGCASSPDLVARTARLTGPGLSDCGPTGTDICARSVFVSGGKFKRGTSGNEATVADFRLDKYEISVGRFRTFVSAWLGGWRPVRGAGKHIHLNGGAGLRDSYDAWRRESGWDSLENGNVGRAGASGEVPSSLAPTTREGWDIVLTGRPAFASPVSPYATWTSNVGANENKPINFVSWYDLYAFCIWDGGFLPSETEWEYAAAGGSEERDYPWGSSPLGTDTSRAIHGCYYGGSGTCTGAVNIAPVGTVSLGQGYWGHMDLAGNMTEVTLDYFSPTLTAGCTNCASLIPSANYQGQRALRSSPFRTPLASSPLDGRVTGRSTSSTAGRGSETGGRCARVP